MRYVFLPQFSVWHSVLFIEPGRGGFTQLFGATLSLQPQLEQTKSL